MRLPAAPSPALPGPAEPAGFSGPPGLRRTAAFLAFSTVAALTAGWPLVARAVPDGEGLGAGQVLRLGPISTQRVSLRVTGVGWRLSRDRSDTGTDFVLTRDGIRLRASRVGLTRPQDADRLWTGLRQVLRASDGGARLGAPRVVRTDTGRAGQTGSVSEGGRSGRAFAFASPARDYGLQVVVLGEPGADAGALREGYALARTAVFAREGV
ncbi:hypothetical protein [Streptomyces sp. NPDC007088]|uniref:hypothetical protein n=1 Tax=Streptomyces sp. NPDC007088 TaxID=3364773 RepID=UPI0036BBC956